MAGQRLCFSHRILRQLFFNHDAATPHYLFSPFLSVSFVTISLQICKWFVVFKFHTNETCKKYESFFPNRPIPKFLSIFVYKMKLTYIISFIQQVLLSLFRYLVFIITYSKYCKRKNNEVHCYWDWSVSSGNGIAN